MTGEEVRDLGYLKWQNEWAWMEKMKGKRWENLIKREKRHFNELATQPYIERETRHMEKEIIAAQEYNQIPPYKIGCGTVEIILVPNSRFYWKWVWSKTAKPALDIDVQGNIVWYITTNEDANFENSLICEAVDGAKIWQKTAVSSQIAVVGPLCYYIKVIDVFRTVELCVCNSRTGGDERVIYREKDKRRDLVLVKGANRALYVTSADPVNSRLYRVEGLSLIPLAKNTLIQMPLGRSIYGDDCILVRDSRFKPWEARGKPLNEWVLPEDEIEWVNLQSGTVITMNEGTQTLWHCSPKKKPEVLMRLRVGYIDPNIWTTWENALIQSFIVKSPFEPPYMVHLVNNKLMRDERKITVKHPIKFAKLQVHRYHTESKDGTKVPYVVIYEKGIKPKAQLIYVYGAYGSSTPIGWPYNTWYPLLKRGWALVFSLIRGGGDIDAAWAEMARRQNRHVSVEDFEAIIRASQHKLRLGPKETVIYGRSAGGLPVGAIVSRFPDGHLVGAAFTEVPYVDVLRTSSNPDLPLTIGEYDEFGNPLEKMMNFRELLSVSPINTLPSDGAPGVFVMSRVGLLDKQVFAYESFKWIQRLRGFASENESNTADPKGKYVTFERDEAHHYRPNKFPRFRAIDLAILDAWADGKLKF